MFYLETERLKLIPLDLYHLRLLRQSRALMEKSLGLEPSAMAVDEFTRGEIAQALETWIAQVSRHEAEYQWYTAWEIVLKTKTFRWAASASRVRPTPSAKPWWLQHRRQLPEPGVCLRIPHGADRVGLPAPQAAAHPGRNAPGKLCLAASTEQKWLCEDRPPPRHLHVAENN
jgi:hypothetical protein